MERRRFLVGFVMALIGGCVTMQARTAKEHFMVSEPQAIAFAKAVKAAQALGGHMTMQDPQHRSVSAKLNKAVVLNVGLEPVPSGTRVTVQATAEGGYILEHDVPDDVQAFIRAYKQQS